MTQTNSTKIVSIALIVFHSRGSNCELCSKVEWRIEKCVQKAKACFPCLDVLMESWNLGMSSFHLTGAKKTFGREIATLWNQRR